jgi:hypothetical protein
LPIISSTRLALKPAALAAPNIFRRPLRRLPSLPNENDTTTYFPVRKRISKYYQPPTLLVSLFLGSGTAGTHDSEALVSAEHLGLILGSQKAADTLLKHFGSLAVLARASVQELLRFVSRSKALRMGAVALREERESLTIDNPLAIADLCSEMRFLDREWLRVVLLNAKQQLIKVATVSQGSVNESLAYPRV